MLLKLLPSGHYYIAPKFFPATVVSMLNGGDPWGMLPLVAIAEEHGTSEKQLVSCLR
jgi:hypothetical protein